MTATSGTALSDSAAPLPRLRFDVIDAKAADILGVDLDKITDEAVGGVVGVSRETISRWRHGHYRPNTAALLRMSDVLGLPIGDLIRAGE